MEFCELNLDPVYFKAIVDGRKTVEGRLQKSKYRVLKAGDTVKFISDNDYVFAVIVSMQTFPDFETMLQCFGIQKCLPGVASLNEAVSIYHDFSNYRDLEKELGVVGIEIKLKE